MVAGGNSVVFNAHPAAKLCSVTACDLVNKAIMKAGGPCNLATMPAEPTMETLDLMEKKCRMIAETADCAVGVVGANLILDSLSQFADEYESHIKYKFYGFIYAFFI